MVSLVNLAVILKRMKKPPYYDNWLVFVHLLYTVVEKQQYLMSTSSYKFSVKVFYSSHASDSNSVYKITCDEMADSHEVLYDCYIG